MNFDWADLVGLAGSVVFLAAFTYANVAKQFDKALFNAANLAGSILLVTSLSVHFNLAAMVLEVCWGMIALAGLVAALRAKGRPA